MKTIKNIAVAMEILRDKQRARKLIQDTEYDEKFQKFLECSKDQGDQGCDSCYFLIYGHYIDPMVKFKTE